jgi:hypothetical protein
MLEISKFPSEPKGWTLDLIYEICKYSDIESEKFDLKLKPNRLYEDICAMANTENGVIVLGIDEIKQNNKITSFEPVGFPNGEQDSLSNEIGNYVSNVEPLPNVKSEHILDKKKMIFFTVVKIVGNPSDRPYFVKGTDQCFVRIQRTTQRVGRSAILNLFSSVALQKTNLQRLLSSLLILKQDIKSVISEMRAYSPQDQTRTAPVDLSFVRNFVIENESFLSKKELLGNRTEDSISDGIIPVLHAVETLNEQIKAYNASYDRNLKSEIKSMIISQGYVLNSTLMAAENTIDKITSKIETRLSEIG